MLLLSFMCLCPNCIAMNLGDGAETRELQCQHEGGSCEFFLLCWMSSGLIQGTCGGFMRGCCHRTAKSANLGASDSNTVDLTSVKPKDYGPVINDPSESNHNPSQFPCAFLFVSCLVVLPPTYHQRTASFPPPFFHSRLSPAAGLALPMLSVLTSHPHLIQSK